MIGRLDRPESGVVGAALLSIRTEEGEQNLNLNLFSLFWTSVLLAVLRVAWKLWSVLHASYDRCYMQAMISVAYKLWSVLHASYDRCCRQLASCCLQDCSRQFNSIKQTLSVCNTESFAVFSDKIKVKGQPNVMLNSCHIVWKGFLPPFVSTIKEYLIPFAKCKKCQPFECKSKKIQEN